MRQQLRLLFFAGMLPLLAHAGPVLTVFPNGGAVHGYPSNVVGWGFTLSNSVNYVLVNSADFCITAVGAGLTVCNQYPNSSLGTFTDYIGLNFIVVGPGGPALESPVVSQAFNATLLTGIGSFTISPAATPSGSFSGQILLRYDLYSRSPNDPAFDFGTDVVSLDNTLTADASFTAAPEPSTFLLMCAGAATLLRRKRSMPGRARQ